MAKQASHDTLLKNTFKAFPEELIRTFFPEKAERLDFSQAHFPDKELFAVFPKSFRREPDVLIQVSTNTKEPELLLIHIEAQTKREPSFPFRMFEYYALLRLHFRAKVFPIVVYLTKGSEGLTKEQYSEWLDEQDELLRFHYFVIGLADLNADTYLALQSPLAVALSALMRPSEFGRVQHKAQCLQQVLHSDLEEGKKALLINLIDIYLILNEKEQQEFRDNYRPIELEVMNMQTTYEERGIRKGKQIGKQEGKLEGKLEGKRELLIRLLARKFGSLSPEVKQKISAIKSHEKLDALSEDLLAASSLEELGLK
ncbi:MAG: DUF4351 domain-containing protein [Fimbriimonadia bacterium]|nr:DUF4351 domain-containing protein [Fimbriimonadia bacterium]